MTKTRNFLSLLGAFLIVLGIAGLTFADTSQTQVESSNATPTLDAIADDSSNGNGTTSPSAPTNVGSDTTWTATISDTNYDDVYLVVCSTDAVTEAQSATGTITFTTGVPADGDYITVDSIIYEFDTAGDGVTGGRTDVDTSSASTVTDVANALVAVENGTSSFMENTAGVVTVVASSSGTSGNSLAMSEGQDTNSYIALSGATLSGGAAPTCGGTTYAISSAPVDTSAGSGTVAGTTAARTTLIGDSESNAWYAFACDTAPGSSGTYNGACTAAGDQGSGDTGSPFYVNHAPTYTSITIPAVDPGGTVSFTMVGDTETDTSGATDTLRMYVCSGESDQGGVTTAFDVASIGTNPCTGGALLCKDDSASAIVEDAVGDTLTATAIPYADYVNINVNISQNTSDALDVSTTTATDLNIKLANTTASNNTAANIQTAVQALGTVGGVDYSVWTFAAGGSWDSATTGATLTTSTDAMDGKTSAGSFSCSDTTDIVSIPTAHGSAYATQTYLIDNHDFISTTQDVPAEVGTNFTVNDVTPVIDSLTVYGTDSSFTTALSGAQSLSSGTTITMYWEGAIHDDNGDGDFLTTYNGRVFDSAASGSYNEGTNNCTTSRATNPNAEHECYGVSEGNNDDTLDASECEIISQSGAGSGKTGTGTDQNATIRCNVPIYFNANAATTWKVHADIGDGTTASVESDSSTFEIGSLTAIDVQTSAGAGGASITYAALSPGSDSGTTDKTVYVANVGNTTFDTLLSGTDMCDNWATPYSSCTGNSIGIAYQKYSESAGTAYASRTAMSSTAPTTGTDSGCINDTLGKRTQYDDYNDTSGGGANPNDPIYFGIGIPAGKASGTYTGQNTFSASAATTTCD